MNKREGTVNRARRKAYPRHFYKALANVTRHSGARGVGHLE